MKNVLRFSRYFNIIFILRKWFDIFSCLNINSSDLLFTLWKEPSRIILYESEGLMKENIRKFFTMITNSYLISHTFYIRNCWQRPSSVTSYNVHPLIRIVRSYIQHINNEDAYYICLDRFFATIVKTKFYFFKTIWFCTFFFL